MPVQKPSRDPQKPLSGFSLLGYSMITIIAGTSILNMGGFTSEGNKLLNTIGFLLWAAGGLIFTFWVKQASNRKIIRFILYALAAALVLFSAVCIWGLLANQLK